MDAKTYDEMWDRFDAARKSDPIDEKVLLQAKNALIEHFYPMVWKVAERTHKNLKEVQIDELALWGIDGLYDAVSKFDRSKGNKFQTYAMHRIKGAMYDNIRKIDWIPRLVRQRANKLQSMKQKFESEEGRALTDFELADKAGMTIEEFSDLVKRSTPVGCVSISVNERSKHGDNENTSNCHDLCSKEKEPIDKIIREEMFQKLMGKNFTKFERKLIHLHYYQDLTMREIAEQTNFSESRISQIHSDILRRLNNKMERNPEYANELGMVISG